MSDETANGTTGEESHDGHILRGPDGAVYVLSDETLQRHRVPDDVADALVAAYEEQAEVSGFQWGTAGFSEPVVGSFTILASGPVIRRKLAGIPPSDTHFDV